MTRPAKGDTIADQFNELADDWEASTRVMSSIHQICMNRSYQRIIGMGPAAVPLILDRMAHHPGHWFWALQAITGEDPVAPEHQGDMAAMTADWVAWGRRRHVLSA